ncbi:hypothetical protein HMPREF0663_11837 [Hoylesella oralis ATCC 33269]|uniref:Uncharacterized protein n=1 Tax=Hoylesella oralis ATCC 33269 TaxID=873533 RepID=E7RRN6_9BACT|nr:hypothetical protein HMPREF0663_11837 [Hoylesella oralis ATCC 33269]
MFCPDSEIAIVSIGACNKFFLAYLFTAYTTMPMREDCSIISIVFPLFNFYFDG